MTKPLTDAERDLAAELLGIAADRFSEHGCSDFDLGNSVPSRAERYEILRGEATCNAGDEEIESVMDDFAAGQPMTGANDWALMLFMAARLRGDA